MKREFTPQIVTANDLLLGDVVYMTSGGTWVRDITNAHIANSAEQAQTMLKHAATRQDMVVGAYLADVIIDDNGKPLPAHFRETFRAQGPSNYFHGKQAAQPASGNANNG